MDPTTGKPLVPGAATAPVPQTEDALTYIKKLIHKYAAQFNIDPLLAEAQAWAESRFKQGAVSSKGALGVFQLMPDTAKALGVDPKNLEQNIRGGVQYLSELLKQYKGDETLALAAYNAGPGAVAKYGGVPPFAETQGYINAINRYRLGGEQRGAASAHISQETKITVVGAGDPKNVADRVTAQQDRVNGDLVRNFAGAVR